jgi:ribosome-associated heat shock protein Hsp15
MAPAGEVALRLDKWLWFARFCKSRTQAASLCAAGRLRLDGTLIHKAHQPVRPGAVLTFPLGPHIRVIRVLALGVRRGPPAEARTLYEDLDPPVAAPPAAASPGPREAGSGRPTKADRRATDRLKSDD